MILKNNPKKAGGLKGEDPYLGAKLSLLARLDRQASPSMILCKAAECGFVDVLRHLIEDLKIHPDATDIFGGTAAMAAASAGQIETLKYLAPISKLGNFDHTGRSALTHAATSNHTICCEIISTHKPKPSWNKDKWTPLMYAAQAGHGSAVRALASCCSIRMRDDEGRDALSIAASGNHLDFALAMLSLTPRPTLASIDRAIAAATRNSFDETKLNETGQALQAAALALREKEEFSAIVPTAKSRNARRGRI